MTQTLQHLRRIGSVGAPTSLLEGQFGFNDLKDGTTQPKLYMGTTPDGVVPNGVALLVGSERQVELAGDQTITGNKTIQIANLKIPGGSPNNTISTDGAGNLTWVPGGAGKLVEAPSDGRIYGRDGREQDWDPVLPLTGGTVTGTLNVTGLANLRSNGNPVVTEAPTDGKPYVRIDTVWTQLNDYLVQGAIPEAPSDGRIYGRDGAAKIWTPALPLSGGTLLGPLTLSGDPTSPMMAVNKDYVDRMISGGGAFTDAPKDGFSYGRNNGYWYRVLGLNGGVMTGSLMLAHDPAAPLEAATKQYVDGAFNGLLPLAGGTMTGNITMTAGTSIILGQNPVLPLEASTKSYVDGVIAARGFPEAPDDIKIYGRAGGTIRDWVAVLPISGGTITGPLVLESTLMLSANPTAVLEAATKGYVDSQIEATLITDAPNDVGPYGRLGPNTRGWARAVAVAGDTMTGILNVGGGGGISDPLVVDVAGGQSARVRYVVRSGKIWTAGALANGGFQIANETDNRPMIVMGADGNIDIPGTNSLRVAGYVTVGASILFGQAGEGAQISWFPPDNALFTNNWWEIRGANSSNVSLDISGRIRSGNWGTMYSLYDNGNYFAFGASMGPLHVWKNGVDQGSIQVTASDRALKSNIEPATKSGLQAVRALRLMEFDWNDSGKHHDIGFVAQDVQDVIPEAALEGAVMSVDLMAITAYTMKAIQELADKVEELEKCLNPTKN